MEQKREPKVVWLTRGETDGDYHLISSAAGLRRREKALATTAEADAYRDAFPNADYQNDELYRSLCHADEAAWERAYSSNIIGFCAKQFEKVTGLKLKKGESVAVTITVEKA